MSGDGAVQAEQSEVRDSTIHSKDIEIFHSRLTGWWQTNKERNAGQDKNVTAHVGVIV